jgi:endonuclease/exonuclease/phosphatase family metal-dependent hydrolase
MAGAAGMTAAGRESVAGAPSVGGSAGSAGTAGDEPADGEASGPSNASGGEAGGNSWRLRALTFNAALAPGFEPQSGARLPKVLSALQDAANQLDVMCVQEFWVDSDFTALRQSTATSLPYAVHPAPLPGTGLCNLAELGSIGACVQTQCSDAGRDDIVSCIQSKCPSEVLALTGGCIGCLLNHLDNFGKCAPTADSVVSNPAIFGGHYDTGLLSRYPISKTQVLPLDAYFQRGAVLYAKLEVPDLGPVHAFCTHFSSSLGMIPYAGPYGSWDGEHTRETEQLLNFIHTKAGDSDPVLVMGDLNMGLALNGTGAVLADDFELLLATGLRDPYLDSGQPQCSECSDNTLRAPDPTNDLIDHLLIQRFPRATAGVTRVFTRSVSLGVSTPPSHLSDHYGLRLELSSP